GLRLVQPSHVDQAAGQLDVELGMVGVEGEPGAQLVLGVLEAAVGQQQLGPLVVPIGHFTVLSRVGADFHSSFTPRLVSWDDFLTRVFVMMDSTDTSYRLAPAEHAFGSTLTAGRSPSDGGHDAPAEDPRGS